jgi:hypothetical protein
LSRTDARKNRQGALVTYAEGQKKPACFRDRSLKTAFGTDTLFDAKLATRQGAHLAKLTRWYTPAQTLRMATADNAELLALSGPRSPYPGKLRHPAGGAYGPAAGRWRPAGQHQADRRSGAGLRRHHEGRLGIQELAAMTPGLGIVLGLLAATALMSTLNRPRADVVGLLMLVAMPVLMPL